MVKNIFFLIFQYLSFFIIRKTNFTNDGLIIIFEKNYLNLQKLKYLSLNLRSFIYN